MNTQSIQTLSTSNAGTASEVNDRLWELAGDQQSGRIPPKRQNPRIHILLPVRLKTGAGGRHLTTMLHDISLTGFQIRCDEQSFKGLGLVVEATADPAVQTLQLSCDLPVIKGQQSLLAIGRVVHVTQIDGEPARSRYAIGCAFETFEQGSDVVLNRYVEEQLMPEGWDVEWN